MAPAPAGTRLLSPAPPGPGSGPAASSLPFRIRQKAEPPPPEPPEVLTRGFPQHLGKRKRSGRSSYRIKLDLTSQQLKEVTVLTPALPGSAGLLV